MITALLIVYCLGLFFTGYIHKIVYQIYNGDKLYHYSLCILIWILSPVFLLGLLVVTLAEIFKLVLRNYENRIRK